MVPLCSRLVVWLQELPERQHATSVYLQKNGVKVTHTYSHIQHETSGCDADTPLIKRWWGIISTHTLSHTQRALYEGDAVINFYASLFICFIDNVFFRIRSDIRNLL